MKIQNACKGIFVCSLAALALCGCARTPEQKAARKAENWLRDLREGKNVSAPENTSLLKSFENLDLDSMSEEEAAFTREYLKDVLRKWDVVSAYQQSGNIVICILLDYADPDQLSYESLQARISEQGLPEMPEEEGQTEAAEESETVSDEAAAEMIAKTDAEEDEDSETEILIEESDAELPESADQLERELKELSDSYLPAIRQLILNTAKEAPASGREIFFTVDGTTGEILSIA